MDEIKAAMNNYMDSGEIIPLEEAYWYMCAIECVASELGYDLTDEELCELVDYFF